MKKNIQSLILTATMLISLLAGCSQTAGPKASSGGHEDITASEAVLVPTQAPVQSVSPADPQPASSNGADDEGCHHDAGQ